MKEKQKKRINRLEMKSPLIWALLNKTGGWFGKKDLWAQLGLAQNESARPGQHWPPMEVSGPLDQWTMTWSTDQMEAREGVPPYGGGSTQDPLVESEVNKMRCLMERPRGAHAATLSPPYKTEHLRERESHFAPLVLSLHLKSRVALQLSFPTSVTNLG